LKSRNRYQRAMRLGAVLFLLALPALPSYARVVHGDAWARQKFALAERMREALNGRPATDRSRRDYQRVIDAYRRVYYGAPTASKADPSVVAVAELQVEMGRRFSDDAILRSAVKQLEFLRHEYPGSKDRFEALFTIGQIYKEDLDDPAQARKTFEEFLHRYPRNRLADDAQSAIAELDQEAEAARKAAIKKEQKERIAQRTRDSGTEASSDSKSRGADPGSRSKFARVTGVRHWSTPDYTRVAIDVEQDVKFDSQRLEHPERIFFDLEDTKLASTLVGKSFDVEDGFLKKIRVAQFQPGRTRIVLEVDNSSDYNAFLLPNPSRLIIDIHGKQSAKAVAKEEAIAKAEAKTAPKAESASDDDPTKLTSSAERDDGEAASVEPGRHPKAAPSRVEVSKPPMKVGVDWQPIPRTIVEADDDSSEDVDSTAIAAADQKPTEKTSTKASTGRKPNDIAVRGHRKIKSADGNNDEVATLNPVELKTGPRPDTATSTGETLSETMESAPVKPSRSSGKRASKRTPAELEVREAKPTASGDRSLIRALGLKIGRIVIDPGHGGHDTGTIGPNGLEEKDLVLDVAKRLGKLLDTRLGANVIYTRQDDTFIPLETRTAIANQEQADLFVSIHANSSRDPDARGVETYYLNFTSNANALEVAARENAVSDKSIHELQDLVKKIALKEKIEESREFATNVQQSLHSGLSTKNPNIRDRGVKKAPFIVLIGANMPSILAEISFVSNPADARKLETAEYRQRIAESLYKGISKYVSGLSGVKVASRMNKGEGQ
jgi:N-acetylmuramoyl-L-alanine amidase